jgi:hypothetical protein
LKKKSESQNFKKIMLISKTSEDVILFHLGDGRVRKRASNTLMNSRERRGKLKVSKLRHYRERLFQITLSGYRELIHYQCDVKNRCIVNAFT